MPCAHAKRTRCVLALRHLVGVPTRRLPGGSQPCVPDAVVLFLPVPFPCTLQCSGYMVEAYLLSIIINTLAICIAKPCKCYGVLVH